MLLEEVTFDRGAVASLDGSSDPALTFPDVPEVVLDRIDRPTEKPWGAGEPSAAIVPAAVSNAVFDATGVRVRSVPFTPAKVTAALQGPEAPTVRIGGSSRRSRGPGSLVRRPRRGHRAVRRPPRSTQLNEAAGMSVPAPGPVRPPLTASRRRSSICCSARVP
ncbi:hypothetical protein JOE48_000117 [Methylobacterium sp. PvR107]|nr:hypothetical protein [Methylobacterium sp. PvR107]